MAKLIYSAIASLDGYIEDADGSFAWSAPDEEVHAFVNDLERPIGTYLYGRRMYETMVYWETAPTSGDGDDAVHHDYATDLAGRRQGGVLDDAGRARQRPDADRARLRPRRDRGSSRRARSATSPSAAPRWPPRRSARGWSTSSTCSSRPIVVGGGKPALPDGVRLQLELLDERRFANGTVHLHYRVEP